MRYDTRWTALPAHFGRNQVAMQLRSRGGSARPIVNAGIGAWENEGGNLAPAAEAAPTDSAAANAPD